MSAEKDKLIKKRGIIKAAVTRFNSFYQSICKDVVVTHEVITQLECRLEKIECVFDEFNDVQFQIECFENDNEIESLEERNAFEKSYFCIIANVKQFLANKAIAVPPGSVSPSLGNAFGSSGSGESQVKLPIMQLPTFDGSYESWQEFFDIFYSLIHANTQIGDIQKFHYLKSSLKRDAAQVIQSLEISSSNYTLAWELLCERYDNKRLIIHNHVKSLFELANIEKESHIKLRQLLDTVNKHLRSLSALKQPTQHWDTLIIYLITAKLDFATMREWESFKISGSSPTMDEMNAFLKQRCEILEKININKIDGKVNVKGSTSRNSNSKHSVSFVSTDDSEACAHCKGSHLIHACKRFLKFPVPERITEVRRLQLCINCLKPNHFAIHCKADRCKRCNKGHNSLLHYEFSKPSAINSESVALSSQSINSSRHVLLSTVLIQVRDNEGDFQECRALLDSGSQSNFITADFCKRLKLVKFKSRSSVIGINQVASKIEYHSRVELKSRFNKYTVNLPCLVLNKISEGLPPMTFDATYLKIPKILNLADPAFASSRGIDMLIGASLFWELMCVGQIKLGKNLPILQKTRFGWIVAGPIAQKGKVQSTSCNFAVESDAQVQDQLCKFWQLEEAPNQKHLSVEEKLCEAHFVNNFTRDNNGRFIVKIPFKTSLDKLGDSKGLALKRFHALERKFKNNPSFFRDYSAFMQEYQQLGHMVIDDQPGNSVEYFLPHHGVVKAESQTTKLRVVFDGSAATTTGYSLNDIEMIGNKIQQDLVSIVLRFRKHAYVVSADVVKMYRQIQVSRNDTNLQKIFWRENCYSTLNAYRLTTVTYGTASAAFLAIRCLNQLAMEHIDKFPKSSRIVINDFYVDDLLTGADSIEEATELCKQISVILKSGCFELRKWVSNNSLLLNNITNKINTTTDILQIGGDDARILGLSWDANRDMLMYNIKEIEDVKSITKRTIIANIAKIFDPLGLLGPCIVTPKLILQKLWQHKLSWDESIPTDLHSMWSVFQKQLPKLNYIKIPRHVVCIRPSAVEMHGFSDASEDAYGACIYLRSIDGDGNIFVRLLCAKSRVAPLKNVSIPRLELCGALLLAQLAERVTESMELNFTRKVYWSDSTIVLCWINTQSCSLKTFVANRISEIQALSEPKSWFHVRSQDNPADLLSRGVNPQDLERCQIWWQGPAWLSRDTRDWPISTSNQNLDIPELKSVSFVASVVEEYLVFERFSTLNKLIRVVAYCKRYIQNSRVAREHKLIGQLSSKELEKALTTLIKVAQTQVFHVEIRSLLQNKNVYAKSSLISLCPFLDKDGVIRVGGRLSNSSFPYSKMHPIVLPPKHTLTRLIATNEHIRCLHAGAQSVLASLRERYWPIAGRNMVKGVVRRCVRCFRVKPISHDQLMGELPAARFTTVRAFINTGVDFAGPLLIKDRRGRGSKSVKVYVCVFVCFAIKAVHLELVTDLSSEAFIAAFRRFSARRGKPTNMYSDNGTNFIGANNDIIQLLNFLKEDNARNDISNALASDGISWHFIPARSPNFGGLWEAGVKAMKAHLKRVVGTALLTFEQLYTVLTQIEAVLNSRPLSPLSCDPNDLNPLTPAHFIIGDSLMAIPDPSLIHIADNRLSEYQRCQQIVQHFWSRWSKEYVSELQQRVKWKTTNHLQLEVGNMVVVKDDNLPPLKWQLGRVTGLHPGNDGIVRVVSIRTHGTTVKRAVSKICVLPIHLNNDK